MTAEMKRIRAEIAREAVRDPESRRIRSEVCCLLAAQGLRRGELLAAASRHPDMKAAHTAALSRAANRVIADPANRAHFSDWQKHCVRDSKSRAKQSRAIKAQWADPEYRAKQSRAKKAQWADPEYRAKKSKAAADPKYRAKKSNAAKALWADPGYRERAVAGMKRRQPEVG